MPSLLPIRAGIALLLLVCALRAQPSGLQGSISTPGGTPLADVRVKAFGEDGKVAATTRSDTAGTWRLNVAAGSYRLRFEAPQYITQALQSVAAPASGVSVVLSPQPISNDEGAVTYRPVVDPERTQQADFIGTLQLMNLPVDQRNYVNLALLTPGVTSSDHSTNASASLQPANDPQSGLSISGNDGRGNIFWLDGGENYINTGGVRTSISQEAVAEFQISRNSFSAEFGGGIGGIVNTISKSGTDSLHGDVFGFLRESDLQARNYFDPGHSPNTRVQSGIAIGGPLKKNKTHYFAAFEQLDTHASAFVSIFRQPSDLGGLSAGQQQLLPYLGDFATPLKQALDPVNYPGTNALLSNNNGVFPLRETSSTGSLRIDHNITDNDQIFFRLNSTGASSANTNLESLIGASQGEKSTLHDATLLANNNLVINSRLVSETRLSLNFYDDSTQGTDPYGPEILISGVASLEREAFVPTKLREWHGQFQQNFFYTPGRHSIRFGVDINPVRNGPSVAFREGGEFVFAKFLPLGAVLNEASGIPNASSLIGQYLAGIGQAPLANVLNEPISALQAYNLGIPAYYLQGFGKDSFVAWTGRYNFFINDVFRATPRLTLNLGVRYELELNKNVPTSHADIGPRFGFAWAATADRKTVVRGGYGIFYQHNNIDTVSAANLFATNQLSLLEIPITGIPNLRNPLTGQPLTSVDVYQTLASEGILGRRPISPLDLAQFGIAPGTNPFPLVSSLDPHFRQPYAEQASLEVERAVGKFSFSAAINFNRALHLPRGRDINQVYGPPNPDGSPTFLPVNPNIADHTVFESRGDSFYTAMILQVARRFSSHFTLDAHYTLSRATDDATSISFLPNNSLDARDDRGLAAFQQKHRFVASGVFSPVVAPGGGLLHRLAGGFLFAPVVVAASGLPFDVETGLEDGQRPYDIGRNTGQGPGYFTIDMRVSRSFILPSFLVADKHTRLEVIAEAFNLLNRTNFAQVDNVVGDVSRSELPARFVGVAGNPSAPFAFTSANPPRQIQVSLKLHW
jgi:hypothetical protein